MSRDFGQLRISPAAKRILAVIWIPGRDRGGRWLDEITSQLDDIDRDDLRRALGELCERGLVAVGRPTSRGPGMLRANGWEIERQLREAAR